MKLSIACPDGAVDVDVADTSSTVSIGDLIGTAGWVDPPRDVFVDGHRHRTTDPLSAVNFFEGSEITADCDGPQALVELVRLAGIGAGRHLALDAGVYDVGSSGATEPNIGRPDQPHFRLTVHPDGTTAVLPLTSNVLVQGRASRHVVTTPDAVYRVEPTVESPPSHGQRQAGRRVAIRAPRLVPNTRARPLDTPLPPDPARDAQPISWLVALAPVPIGIVLAIVFSPFFLAFAAMSPAISIARWRDGRKRERVNRATHARLTIDGLHHFASAIRSRADAEAQLRRDQYCDTRRQYRAAADANAQLWEVRPDHADFLHLTVGLGERSWTPEINHRAEMDGIDQVIDACGFLVSAPVTVDLNDVRGIGVVGDADHAHRLASALVLETVVRHGPADVELNCLFDDAAVDRWSWVKWLSHLHTSTGEARLATTDAQTQALLERPERAGYASSRHAVSNEPTPLLLIDGHEPLMSGANAASTVVNRYQAVAIVVADHAEDLPAFCGAVVHVNHTGVVRLTRVASGEVVSGIIAPLVDPETAERTARTLARYSDAESSRAAVQLVERCQLSEVLAARPTSSETEETWRRNATAARSDLRATLGVCVDGRFEIDLVRDGPHALIAGTTGAGKSELLRTLVASLAWRYSPEQVTFVLVDFKGGGAFDACAELPHTVGVVTDLDATLSARALRCLRAELLHRERRLRAAGVSDITDLPPDADALPRLVIVVDEFATLAKELPEFMDSLVDVAQRGRSLGIHMVLATQRPAGVVDNKIRANTNLRIALRVQDDNDAIEVVGSTVAAEIHRSQQGRAFARLGAGEIVPFQTATVSAPLPGPTSAALRLTHFELCRSGPASPADDRAPIVGSTEPSELDLVTRASRRAAASLGLAAPRVPWPPPLPDHVDLHALDQPTDASWTVAVGWKDMPDEQRRDVFHWSGRTDGNVLVYGVDSPSSTGVLATLCIAIATTHEPDRAHLYVVDFAGALSALDDYPHVGGYLGPEDGERISRLLDLLDAELDARRSVQRDARSATLGPADVPLLGVFIANYSGLMEHFEDAGDLDAQMRVAAVIRDGPALGMFVFASGAGERGIPMKVASHVPTKFVMRMADPAAYTTFGLRAADVPEMGPGRAVDTRSKLEIQFATASHADMQVRREPVDGGPILLRTLDDDIGFDRIAAASRVSPDVWRLAIGIDHDDLSAAHLELRPGVHAVVAGPPASGRSTTLRTIAAALQSADEGIAVGSIGIDGVGVPLTSAVDLEAFADGGGLLLVDDLELLPGDLGPMLDRLIAQPPHGLRLVVSGRVDTLRAMNATSRLLTAGRTGVLLQPQPDAGDVFRVRLRFKGPFPVGRGVLLNGASGGVVQVAHTARLDQLVDAR